MNTNPFSSVEHTIEQILTSWGLSHMVEGRTLATSLRDGASHCETRLPDGTSLALLRLYCPLVRREEVFLGGVLLNDFLSKALLHAGERLQRGRMVLLVNDLESYYYLCHWSVSLEELVASLREEVIASLPDLYFGEENPARGIHGTWQRMFTFTSSQYEPLPVYAIPGFLARQFEQAVRKQLRRLLDEELSKERVRTILATLAFCYGQTSGGKDNDVQSPPTFLFRLVNTYAVVERGRVAEVFGLQEVTKETIQRAIDSKHYIVEELRALIEDILTFFWEDIDRGRETWLLGFIRRHKKLIACTEHDFFAALVNGVYLGYVPLSPPESCEAERGCRLCGRSIPRVLQKHVTFGFGAFRFHNKSLQMRQAEPTLCIRCVVSSYLQLRLLGLRAVRKEQSTVQTPDRSLLAFHYGEHDDRDAHLLAENIDALFHIMKQLEQQARREKQEFTLADVREHVTLHSMNALPAMHAPQGHVEADLFADDSEDVLLPGVATLLELNRDVQAQVVSLGTGAFRLFAIVLPQLQSGSREDVDFVQQRFSHSRLAAFTLLALLRTLCRCDGAYYFRCEPQLRCGSLDPHTFYVNGRGENVERVLHYYSVLVNFARRVTKARKGHSLFADWIALAERIEAAPLALLSEILRRTPLRPGDFAKKRRGSFLFEPLAGRQSITSIGAIDTSDYLRFLEMVRRTASPDALLHHSKGEGMKGSIETELLDEFCDLLFHTLDELSGGKGGVDFLPWTLNESPYAFEKYPRLLFSAIAAQQDVVAGFDEWASKILRDASPYRREAGLLALLEVKRWLVEHRECFEDRSDYLTHLKQSVFCLAYAYLSPRRRLAVAYAEAHRGNREALQEEVIRATFLTVVASDLAALQAIYGEGPRLSAICQHAQAYLIENRFRYQWKARV